MLSCRAAVCVLMSLALMVSAAELTGPRRRADAARRDGKIVVDGRLDEDAWQKAPVNTDFRKAGLPAGDPLPKEVQTTFRVLYDEAALYFGIRCNEPKMEDLVVKVPPVHDAAMWGDDDVEIFLDPVGDRNEYYQFAVNTEGTQTDLYLIERGNTGKAGWSADWTAKVFKRGDFWSVEIRIPFAALHNRPAAKWSDNWVFNLTRTRKPKPSYYSQFTPCKGYHEVRNFGTLGPIEVPPQRYNLYADSPEFVLSPADAGYDVTAFLDVQNRGESPVSGNLSMEILAEESRGGRTAVRILAGERQRIKIAGGFVKEQARIPAIFRLKTDDHEVLNLRVREWMRYTPLTIRLSQPNYRDAVYATQSVDAIEGVLELGVPLEKVRGLTARVTLSSPDIRPRRTEMEVTGERLSFSLPAEPLPEGRHVIRGEILRPGGADSAPEVVVDAEVSLRRLAAAPDVEARVDAEGNLLLDGAPVFIRGWYGSMSYVVSKASFPEAQVPRTSNFMMGGPEYAAKNFPFYRLKGLTRLEGMEVKEDKVLPGALKARLREAVASVRGQTDIVGYYLSDEPECRGLSAYHLRQAYEFLKRIDPYRFVMIVSRAPARYMRACDVMCPHPYLNPQVLEDGTRKFGNYILGIRNVMREAARANDGSKAIWCMPQTFSYGGKYAHHPNFQESRWFAHTALANGARGLVPFIFKGYWNHWENRVAMKYVFEELALLAPAWLQDSSEAEVSVDDPRIDAVGRYHKPSRARHGQAWIVATNQSYEPRETTLTVPRLAEMKARRLIVLREGRTVPVEEDGTFTDDFGRLGVHIYTTNQILPDLADLEEIRAEVEAPIERAREAGNLLLQPGLRWRITGEPEKAVPGVHGLADGVTDAAGWLPVYADRSRCEIRFEEPVTFRRVVFHSPTLKGLKLLVRADDDWREVHVWSDVLLQRFEWSGRPQTTTAIRLVPAEFKTGYPSWTYPEITELGLYAE